MKGLAPGLGLEQRRKATRKSPIARSFETLKQRQTGKMTGDAELGLYFKPILYVELST